MYPKTGSLKFPALLAVIYLISVFNPSHAAAQTGAGLRSIDRIFPGLSENRKKAILGDEGLILTHKKNESLELIPARDSGIDLQSIVMKAKPAYLTESLLVVPYSGRVLNRLDAYNALGKIQGLKGRLYRSHSRKAEIPLFEDATRLESAKKTNAISDPPPARELPLSETVYIRLKDVNFGNSFYRGDISVNSFGVTYSLTNFKSLSYLFFTVMKEEKFSAVLYMEPLKEGMLVYSMAGADASDFIANRIDIPSAIGKRLAVFNDWISDGLKAAQ